jgi:hypothetical protein
MVMKSVEDLSPAFAVMITILNIKPKSIGALSSTTRRSICRYARGLAEKSYLPSYPAVKRFFFSFLFK